MFYCNISYHFQIYLTFSNLKLCSGMALVLKTSFCFMFLPTWATSASEYKACMQRHRRSERDDRYLSPEY